jgi:protease I
MAENIRLDGMQIAILVTDDFEQVELTEPKRALDVSGAVTTIIAPHSGQVQGMNHDEKADRFNVDLTLDEADPDDYDAVLLPGGVINADALRMEPKAQQFIRQIDAADKPIAVICHGSWLLVSAGLATGRVLTSYHTLQDDIRNAGGRWVDLALVHDQNWVSSRFPDDIPLFNQGMMVLFSEYQEIEQEESAA